MTRRWESDELRALVEGARILGRDASVQSVRLPDWLTLHGQPDPRPWENQLDAIAAADRPRVIDSWWTAVGAPAELVETEFARHGDDGWVCSRISYLNLTHQDDVNAILIVVRDLGPVDEPAPQNRADTAYYSAPSWIVQHLDAVGTILRTDGHVEAIFGVPDEELVGTSVVERLHPDDHAEAIAMWLEVLGERDSCRTIDQRIVRANGSAIWINSTVINRLDESGSVLSFSRDITRARLRDAELRAREQELRFLTDEVPVAVFRARSDGRFTVTNNRFEELLGAVTSLDELIEAIHEDEREAVERTCRDVLASGATGRVRGRVVAGNRFLELRIRGIVDHTPGTRSPGLIGTIDDVTSQMVRAFRLQESAERDALTDLANRRGVQRALAAAVADEGPVLVVFGDLDGFKSVNDRWGHDAGDLALKAIGERLRSAVRPGDVVGRWGGDEFVIVCRGVPVGTEDEVLRRLDESLRAPITLDDGNYQAAASLGAVRPVDGESAESLLRRADTQMYESKRNRHKV